MKLLGANKKEVGNYYSLPRYHARFGFIYRISSQLLKKCYTLRKEFFVNAGLKAP